MMNPSIVLSNAKEQCLTFYWEHMPQYYVGYRFIEGEPSVGARSIPGYEKQPVARRLDLPEVASEPARASLHSDWRDDWLTAHAEQDDQATVQYSFRLLNEGVAHVHCVDKGGKQLEMFLKPFTSGVRIQATLTTVQAIERSYCLQQCLRFTGMYNAKWRQAIAHTPFLSEFDMQAMGNPNGTLTSARRENQWFYFPVQYVIYPTHNDFTARDAESESVDHGLIVRESPSRQVAPASYWDQVAPGTTWEQITCGMYWERTAYISNRHPADCVHAWVDFGPLEAGQSRTLMGAVYFIEGSKDDLLRLWQKDFQSTS